MRVIICDICGSVMDPEDCFFIAISKKNIIFSCVDNEEYQICNKCHDKVKHSMIPRSLEVYNRRFYEKEGDDALCDGCENPCIMYDPKMKACEEGKDNG